PLHLFEGVYVKPSGDAAHFKAVGQVEQMYASKCFRMTKGKWVEETDASGKKTRRRQDLGCISCHDPHKLPDEKDRISFYRDRCLKCHDERPSPGGRPACSFPFQQRQAKQDSCMACHMPRLSSRDVVHTAITDHRLHKRPEKRKDGQPHDEFWFPGERPLLHFHQDLLDRSSPDYLRNLGMAYVRGALEDPTRQDL